MNPMKAPFTHFLRHYLQQYKLEPPHPSCIYCAKETSPLLFVSIFRTFFIFSSLAYKFDEPYRSR